MQLYSPEEKQQNEIDILSRASRSLMKYSVDYVSRSYLAVCNMALLPE